MFTVENYEKTLNNSYSYHPVVTIREKGFFERWNAWKDKFLKVCHDFMLNSVVASNYLCDFKKLFYILSLSFFAGNT